MTYKCNNYISGRDWESNLSGEEDEQNLDMDGDGMEFFEGCENANNKDQVDAEFRKEALNKLRSLDENNEQNEDNESIYADSEFAEAIAKASETSSSSKLRSSKLAKMKQDAKSKRKRPEGMIRPPLRNHPQGGRLAPIPDNMQVTQVKWPLRIKN